MDAGPALVSILRQGDYLIVSIHTALDDSQMVRFQQDLIDQIGRHRSRGVIIDVAALDVLDSFATSTLRDLAEMARLRGARTVIVGIQPDVAFAMVELGMNTRSIETALDLEEGLHYLARHRPRSGNRSGGHRGERARTAAAQLPDRLPAIPSETGRGRTTPRIRDQPAGHDRRSYPA